MEQIKGETKKSGIGMKILMGLLVLMVGSLAFAGVVSYLSNTVQANVNVTNPMTMTINGGTNTLDINTKAGEVISFTTVGTNTADKAVDVYSTTFTLTAPTGTVWTGDEFTTINLVDRNVDKENILPVLYVVNNDGTRGPLFKDVDVTSGYKNLNVLRVMADETPLDGVFNKYSHPAGLAIDNLIDIDLADNLTPGTYTVVAQALFSLEN